MNMKPLTVDEIMAVTTTIADIATLFAYGLTHRAEPNEKIDLAILKLEKDVKQLYVLQGKYSPDDSRCIVREPMPKSFMQLQNDAVTLDEQIKRIRMYAVDCMSTLQDLLYPLPIDDERPYDVVKLRILRTKIGFLINQIRLVQALSDD